MLVFVGSIIFCVKNYSDGINYANKHSLLSFSVSREVDLEEELMKEQHTQMYVKSANEQMKGKRTKDANGVGGRHSREKNPVKTITETNATMNGISDINKKSHAPVNNQTSTPILSKWHPTKQWIQTCSQQMSKKTRAQGEWNIPVKIAIADCIKFCRCYHRPLPPLTFNKLYVNLACPLTFSNPNDKRFGGDFNLTMIDEIHRIQGQLPQFTIPSPETLVIHLRLGDIIETSSSSVEDILMKGADPGYPTKNFLNSIKSVHEILDNIYNISTFEGEGFEHMKVQIVGGTHRKEYWQKSRVYAACLHRAIQNAGFMVDMRLEGAHPDEDFYYISHAKRLIVSAGGYSNLMGKLAEYRGGKIAGRSFGVSW